MIYAQAKFHYDQAKCSSSQVNMLTVF